MKRSIILLLSILSIALAGCQNSQGRTDAVQSSVAAGAGDGEIMEETTSNPTQEDFQGEDFFIYEGLVCVNASDIDWVRELGLAEGAYLGEITRMDATGTLADWEATDLPVGTKIYESRENPQILIAVNDNGKLPYMKVVEG